MSVKFPFSNKIQNIRQHFETIDGLIFHYARLFVVHCRPDWEITVDK